jgi:hypothetical protein
LGPPHEPDGLREPSEKGIGHVPSSIALTERRPRELEGTYGRHGGQAEVGVRWLVDQVRRSRHALVQILAAAQDVQDAEPGDALASRVRFPAPPPFTRLKTLRVFS